MGADQSRESNNEQRTRFRNFTEAEVRRALDAQKAQLEKEMNDLLRSQAASAKAQAAPSTPSSSSSTKSQRVAYSTIPNVTQGVNEGERATYSHTPNNLVQQGVNERERAPYSHTPHNLVQQGVNERERAPYSRTPNNLVQQGVKERERAPYSHTQNNLVQQGVKERERAPYSHAPNNNLAQNLNERESAPYSQTQNANQTSAPLYPTLPTHGNQAPGTNYNPQDPVNGYVYYNQRYGRTSTPSAPPMPSAPARQGRTIYRNPGPRLKAESDDVACPTCKYRYTEKIFNCESGHASCSECMSRYMPCGKLMLPNQPCGLRITDMRNITMEEYVNQNQMSCPNADEGCKYIIAPGNLERHLQDCPFKEVQCFMPGRWCRWNGKLSKLADHFDQCHSECRGEIDTERFLHLDNTNKTIELIKLGNYNFIVHQYTVNNKVFIAVQLIGTKTCASKWCYELHIFKKAEPRRKYVYTDNCFSIRQSFDDIIKDSACAVLPLEYAKTFDNGSGALVFKYYIKKGGAGGIDKEERQRDGSCTKGGRGRGRSRGRGRGGHAK